MANKKRRDNSMEEIVKVTIDCINGEKQELSGNFVICGVASNMRDSLGNKTGKIDLHTVLSGRRLPPAAALPVIEDLTLDLIDNISNEDDLMTLVYLNNVIEFLQETARERKKSLTDRVVSGGCSEREKELHTLAKEIYDAFFK